MKKCEKCQKEYQNILEKCPYCNSEERTIDLVWSENRENCSTELQVENVDENKQLMEEESITQHKTFCKYCGNIIKEGNDYCNHCGRDIYDKDKRHCTNCGNVLKSKQTFCDKCGHKATRIKLPKKLIDVKQHISKKKMIETVIAVVFVLALVITGIKVVPKFFVKYDTYLAEGNYEKAYAKAGEDEKDLVVKENIAAIVSSLIKESLKDSSSFVLREVYIEEMKNVVIKNQGNNSYGGAVSDYVWYQWNEKKSEFESWGSCSDFDKEKIESWDDTDDMLDKLAGNIVKNHVEDVIDKKDLKLDSATVNRINGLNKSGKLGDVKLLDQAKKILEKKEDDSKS